MTHGSHGLAPRTPVLTQGFACYWIYECADGRMLTVGALEPKFFARLCELLEQPELAASQYDADQAALEQELADVFSQGRWKTGCACSNRRTCAWGLLRPWPRLRLISACPHTALRRRPAPTRPPGDASWACDRSRRGCSRDQAGADRCTDAPRGEQRDRRTGSRRECAQPGETHWMPRTHPTAPSSRSLAPATSGSRTQTGAGNGASSRRPTSKSGGRRGCLTGQAIVYSARIAERRQIRVLRLPTGSSIRVAGSNGEEYGATVSRTGRLAFVSTRGGAPVLYTAQANSVGTTPFDTTPPATPYADVHDLAWSPDGKKLAYRATVERRSAGRSRCGRRYNADRDRKRL